MDDLLCASCSTAKPCVDFNRNRARKTGYDNYCRDCMKARARARDASRRKHVDDVPPERQCSVDGCTDRLKGAGYCNRHLKRFRAYGDPLAGGKFHDGKSQRPRRADHMTLDEAFEYFMPGDPPPAGEVWAWTGSLDDNGYGTIRHGGKNHAAHRVSYERFVGPIPDGLHIRHKNDTPIDVNPNNMELGTLLDNVRDREQRGRTFSGVRDDPSTAARGVSHGLAKLKDDDVREIRNLYARGRSQQSIADQFGVSQFNISCIVRRVTWAHVR